MFQQKNFSYQMPALSLDAKLKQGLQHHQNGQLHLARPLYEDILRSHPTHPDALHFLGVIESNEGKYARAVELIGKSIAVNPNNPSSYLNLGNAQNSSKQLNAALESYGRAIALLPDYVPAHLGRAAVLEQLGQLDDALASIDVAIRINPENAIAHYNRGNVLRQRRSYEEAIGSYDLALSINAEFAEAHLNRGTAKAELQQWDSALACFNQAIAIRNNFDLAYFYRGKLLHDIQQFDAALQSFDQALAINPYLAEVHFYRGNVLSELQQLEAALQSYDKAIDIQPDYAEAYSNRGATLNALKRFEAAKQSYDKAIDIQPNFAEAYSNRGVALKNLKQLEAALQSYDRAIAIKPEYAEAYANRGNVLKDLGRFAEALQSYERAIAIAPSNALAHNSKSLLLLLSGDFANGWPSFEWRWKDAKNGLRQRHFTQPMWNGSDSLQGLSVLLHAEQGLGDTIQFARYAKLVAARGARVLLEVEKPLYPLFQSLEGVSQLMQQGDELPEFDYHCPLLSLPLAFNTSLETIPSSPQYLRSDNETLATWQRRLGAKGKPRIGLVWSGSTIHKNDENRSLPLAQFVEMLPDRFEYISLQKDVRDADVDTLRAHPYIRQMDGGLQDFSDTAALCSEMDLVISVDTSVAHLAGALGIPTWILLPYLPDWRWLLNRYDSPWYPSVKLFRQPSPFQWEPVLREVRAKLSSANSF